MTNPIIKLNPTNSNVAIILGFRFDIDSSQKKRTSFVLRCAIKNSTDTFLVRVPVEVGEAKYIALSNELTKHLVAGVVFSNVNVKDFYISNNTIYSGTADDFTIIKRRF